MKKYVAEFFGTAMLVTFGCGTAVALSRIALFSSLSSALFNLAIALAFGLILTVLCYSIGHVSGCHVNPAVSFAMLITKRISASDFLAYIASQFLGGIAGAGLLSLFFWQFRKFTTFGANEFATENAIFAITPMQAALIEIVLTCVFVLVILTVTAKEEMKAVSGVVIGLALTVVHILGIPFTGTSVNPARSLGPALMTQLLTTSKNEPMCIRQILIFIGAPIIGAFLAALLYTLFSDKKKEAAIVDAPVEETENAEVETAETVEA